MGQLGDQAAKEKTGCQPEYVVAKKTRLLTFQGHDWGNAFC